MMSMLQTFIAVAAAVWAVNLNSTIFAIHVVLAPSGLPPLSPQDLKVIHSIFCVSFSVGLWFQFVRLPIALTRLSRTLRAAIHLAGQSSVAPLMSPAWYAFWGTCLMWSTGIALSSASYCWLLSQYTDAISVFHGLSVGVVLQLASFALWLESL